MQINGAINAGTSSPLFGLEATPRTPEQRWQPQETPILAYEQFNENGNADGFSGTHVVVPDETGDGRFYQDDTPWIDDFQPGGLDELR